MFNPKNLILTLLFLFVLIPLPFTPVRAQTSTATLSGTVQDENSAVIPGVSISVQNDATSLERHAVTNESGSFTVPLLPPGTYTITATRDGFTPIKVTNVVLNVADQKALSFQMRVGSVDAAVQVTPDASLVSTSPAVATTIDRNFVQNMPLNGRSFQSLILLTPGVVPTIWGQTTPGDFSVNGQRQNANYFTVDGVGANTGISANSGSLNQPRVANQQFAGTVPGYSALGTTASLVPVDALEEFKIQTSTTSAEYGRQPGGQVQLVTRSGNNDFHGTLFESLRNDALNASDWFRNANALPKSPERQNQFGGTFSGPVILPRFGEGGKSFWHGRDKTFFYFSYEGTRLLIPETNFGWKVPSLRLRQAASPFIQPLLNAYALPTGPETIVDGEFSGFAPAAYAYSNPSQADTYSIRIDHNLNKKLALFGRFSQTPSQSKTRIVNYLNGQVNNSRSVTLGATYIVSPQVTNEFRFNYSSNRGTSSNTLDTFGGGVPIDVSKIVSGYTGPGTTQASVNLFLPGDEGRLLGYALGNDVDNYQRQFNVVDSISFASGSHLVKAGFDWRRLMPVIGPVNYLQTIYFTNQDEIVNGKASLVAIFARQGSRPIFDNFSSYVQDTWKVSNRLTLDLGLRWELNPAPHDANGVRPVTLTGIQGTDVSKAALAPSGTPIYKTFYTAFAPRIGAAYQLRQKSGRETVLRGGFGVYYDLGNGQSTSGFLGFPFASRNNVFNVELPLTPALARPAGFPPVQLPIENDLYATNPDLKLPYTLQWNIAVQQSLGKNQTVTASYVASAGRRLLVTWTLNQSPQDPVTGDFLPPPNSNFGNILFTDNGPTSDYHSLQLQYQRRLSRGLQAVVNYTWSHAIDEVSNEVIGNYLERGNADFDVRHNLSAAFTYQIPKLNRSDNAFLRSLVNGWSIDGIFFLNSGIPLEVRTNSVVTPDGRFVQGRPDLVLGQPIWIKDSTVAGGERLNPLAFARPPLVNGRLTRRGTLGRNVIFAPGIYQLNMGLSRQFSLGEKPRLQLKADVFNVLNHPMFADRNNFYFPGVTNLGIPNSMLGSGGFAAGYGGLNSLYQLGGPRSIQLSARFSF